MSRTVAVVFAIAFACIAPAVSQAATNWDPSGVPMPVGNPAGYTQVFADNFANDSVPVGGFSGCRHGSTLLTSHCSGLPASVDSKWFAYGDGWSGTPKTGTYYPSKTMSIQNGVMTYFIHTATVNGVVYHMIDAAVPKISGSSDGPDGMLYGRYIVRARIASLHGYHVAFLLWPDSGVWPGDGEIDFPEADFDSPTVYAFMHWRGATSGSQQDWFRMSVNMSQWHTYRIDWTPTALSFYVDGALVGRDTNVALIPDTAMHWVLETEVSRKEGTPSNSTAGNVQIDWAAAYKSTS